jgi:hypothetical protein
MKVGGGGKGGVKFYCKVSLAPLKEAQVKTQTKTSADVASFLQLYISMYSMY